MKIFSLECDVNLLCVMVVLLCIILSHPLYAQIDTLSLGVDELFLIARKKAFGGEREEVRKLCRIILQRSPMYDDVRILLGRTYTWDGRRDEARKELMIVLSQQPANTEAILALADVELWDDKPDAALDLLNRGINSSPNNDALLVKKARALRALKKEEQALSILNLAEDINPSNPEVTEIRHLIQLQSMSNTISINYSLDHYSDYYDPMKYAALQWGRRTSIGSLIARINYASRFQTHGWQVEMDSYPRIADGYYAYINYGYSVSTLFPRHRFGFELYMRLPSSMEGSLGLRHLYFERDSKVTMYTGTIGIYSGNFWFSLRPTLTPDGGNFSKSVTLSARYYLGSSEDYFSVKGGIGFSPDERAIQSSTGLTGKQLFYLKSQTIGLGWQGGITDSFAAYVNCDYTNQELSFRSGYYVVMYSISLGMRVKF
ncbi:MAG: YaiO family outer membrane beta-barrel protein [bacterium]